MVPVSTSLTGYCKNGATRAIWMASSWVHDPRAAAGLHLRSLNELLDLRGASGGWTLHYLNEVAARIAYEADS